MAILSEVPGGSALGILDLLEDPLEALGFLMPLDDNAGLSSSDTVKSTSSGGRLTRFNGRTVTTSIQLSSSLSSEEDDEDDPSVRHSSCKSSATRQSSPKPRLRVATPEGPAVGSETLLLLLAADFFGLVTFLLS